MARQQSRPFVLDDDSSSYCVCNVPLCMYERHLLANVFVCVCVCSEFRVITMLFLDYFDASARRLCGTELLSTLCLTLSNHTTIFALFLVIPQWICVYTVQRTFYTPREGDTCLHTCAHRACAHFHCFVNVKWRTLKCSCCSLSWFFVLRTSNVFPHFEQRLAYLHRACQFPVFWHCLHRWASSIQRKKNRFFSTVFGRFTTSLLVSQASLSLAIPNRCRRYFAVSYTKSSRCWTVSWIVTYSKSMCAVPAMPSTSVYIPQFRYCNFGHLLRERVDMRVWHAFMLLTGNVAIDASKFSFYHLPFFCPPPPLSLVHARAIIIINACERARKHAISVLCIHSTFAATLLQCNQYEFNRFRPRRRLWFFCARTPLESSMMRCHSYWYFSFQFVVVLFFLSSRYTTLHRLRHSTYSVTTSWRHTDMCNMCIYSACMSLVSVLWLNRSATLIVHTTHRS